MNRFEDIIREEIGKPPKPKQFDQMPTTCSCCGIKRICKIIPSLNFISIVEKWREQYQFICPECEDKLKVLYLRPDGLVQWGTVSEINETQRTLSHTASME